ncbi:MAG: ABC transporter substrate-binding protein [Xanthobacteraceae bacterium]
MIARLVVTLGEGMKRRDFIRAIAATAAAWPVAARAQPPDRVRHIGVLMNLAPEDPESQRRVTAFVQALQELGWTDGRNVRIETRWGLSDADRNRRYAAELVTLAPDVILAAGTPVLVALQRETRSIPIVFTTIVDPVGAGFAERLSRPGGNATGFTLFEYAISGKWLELLKELSPDVTRVAVIRDPVITQGIGQFAAIQAVSPPFGVELIPIGVREKEIETAVEKFVQEPHGGLIVTAGSTAIRRDPIIALAARHRLPAVYPFRYHASSGGLMSYGPNTVEPYRRAAGYVNRILKGEKPADLPVQNPTKYELVINMKTAKALGINVPPALLARADEVIE